MTTQLISEKRGVRWSSMNYLPAWLPGRSSLIEFMHAVFLSKYLVSCLRSSDAHWNPAEAMVKHICRVILLKSGMFNGGSYVKPMHQIECFFASLIWPVEATHLPPSLSWYNISNSLSYDNKTMIAYHRQRISEG
jgi:hypothetical protein